MDILIGVFNSLRGDVWPAIQENGLAVTGLVATVVGAIYTVKSYHSNAKIDNASATGSVLIGLDETKPQLAISSEFTHDRDSFTVKTHIQNSGSGNVVITKIFLIGEYQTHSGKRYQYIGQQDFLGEECTLPTRRPVLGKLALVSPEIKLHLNGIQRFSQRVKYQIEVVASTRGGESYTLRSDPVTKYFV